LNVVVCGGRKQRLTPEREAKLSEVLWQLNDGRLTLILGGAQGIDTDVEEASYAWGYPFRRFDADWGRYGDDAGPFRNEEQAKVGDVVVAFPGGSGTCDMVRRMRAKGARVIYLT
jgi:hypothetical protein